MALNTKKIDLCSFRLACDLEQEFKKELIENEVHFRGSLHTLSLISVSKTKPELGVIYGNYRARLLVTLFSHIKKIAEKPCPKRITPEKLLQAWVIKQAQMNNGFLPFNKSIKYITSKLTIKHNGTKFVSDIIGYDINTQQIVIIELKSDRLFKRLKEQVDNFAEIFSENYDFFHQLLEVYGFNKLEKIPKKTIVWPMARTSPLQKWNHFGIEEYTYEKKGDDYCFLNHSAKLFGKDASEIKVKPIKEFV